MRILLVEDEKDIAGFIIKGLKAEKFVVDWTPRSEQALFWAKVNNYDLAIMDITISGDKTGIEVCRLAREKGRAFPILMLSVVHDTATKVKALNAGADDYLTKPFSMIELLARARALMRREKKIVGPVLAVGDLSLDLNAHTVTRGRKAITLNRKEFGLLEYLMRNPGTTFTRSMILEHVWETTTDPFTNTVDVHIRFLRRKIDDDRKTKLIKTVHGYGYKIEE
ncbi:MAG TPA: response regulator transcription factor [Candidatus Paceibacterota bacterium]|nr:response regulator transcription factor [Candidatus Paceibacterota bacterium]